MDLIERQQRAGKETHQRTLQRRREPLHELDGLQGCNSDLGDNFLCVHGRVPWGAARAEAACVHQPGDVVERVEIVDLQPISIETYKVTVTNLLRKLHPALNECGEGFGREGGDAILPILRSSHKGQEGATDCIASICCFICARC